MDTKLEQTNEQQAKFGFGRRDLLKLTGAGAAAAGVISLATTPAFAQYAGTWDKTFRRSDHVEHRKVSYVNRLGINLVPDMYAPKNLDASVRHPALIVGHPYGGVKEQTSGLYAQTMADAVSSRLHMTPHTMAKAVASRASFRRQKPPSKTSVPVLIS